MNTSEKYNESFVELTTTLQALAHPARMQIVEHLAKYHECPAGAISSELPLSKSTVSQHMAKLREAGLISSNQSGVCQNYRLNLEKLNEVIHQLESFGDYVNLLSKTKTSCKKLVSTKQMLAIEKNHATNI